MQERVDQNTLQINVSEPIFDQFSIQLEGEATEQQFMLHSKFGEGIVDRFNIPLEVEVLQFQFVLSQAFAIHSRNPVDSDWLLLNINLSEAIVEKQVNEQALQLQRYLPSGMLLYTPGTQVRSASSPNQAYNIFLIRFRRSFLTDRFGIELTLLDSSSQAIIYEDLDTASERLLRACTNNFRDRLLIQANTLLFLRQFIAKLRNREAENGYENLHPQDIQGLFLAAANLRDPLRRNPPGIADLAKIAAMSKTKFKTSFKQVFGQPPLQYHLRIKMEYAKSQLQEKQKSASEISYQLGYSHPSKFTLAFKKHFGTLPSDV
ncbi:MAG: helix-turn-helix transcriptional regulator [Saprospiraceae bacterium]|nr:helix-turn-helix transcriptional regulator [Saprospiraceae bacterium]